MMSKNTLATIPGSIIILQNMVIFAKFVKFFIVITFAQLAVEEEHGLIIAVLLRDNPKRRLQPHEKSATYLKAILIEQTNKQTLRNKTH